MTLPPCPARPSSKLPGPNQGQENHLGMLSETKTSILSNQQQRGSHHRLISTKTLRAQLRSSHRSTPRCSYHCSSRTRATFGWRRPSSHSPPTGSRGHHRWVPSSWHRREPLANLAGLLHRARPWHHLHITAPFGQRFLPRTSRGTPWGFVPSRCPGKLAHSCPLRLSEYHTGGVNH